MKTARLRKKLQMGNYKKIWMIAGISLAVLLLVGLIFFFTYFRVQHVEVLGSSHYSESEVKEMILQGTFADNTVLAPVFCSKDGGTGIPFVEGFQVKQMNHDTLIISVKEKQPVGCIPYLDSYVYFDRNGIFIESSRERKEKVPYFDGIEVENVVLNEKLPIKGKSILNTAVALSTIFQKNDMLPDHIAFDESNQISLVYGDITVQLGEDKNLEDKMAKAFAIIPKITGRKGILHLESDSESSRPTFEQDAAQMAAEAWTGGYDENGEYTGEGEYDEEGNYVGPKPEVTDSDESAGEGEEGSDDGEDGSGDETWEDSYGDGSGYDDGSYDDGSYDDGSYDDGSYDDGSYDDGSYDDGSYDDGSYDDEGYEEGSYE